MNDILSPTLQLIAVFVLAAMSVIFLIGGFIDWREGK